jgi:hypothetical protein
LSTGTGIFPRELIIESGFESTLSHLPFFSRVVGEDREDWAPEATVGSNGKENHRKEGGKEEVRNVPDQSSVEGIDYKQNHQSLKAETNLSH